jgi:hypothetical protein
MYIRRDASTSEASIWFVPEGSSPRPLNLPVQTFVGEDYFGHFMYSHLVDWSADGPLGHPAQ